MSALDSDEVDQVTTADPALIAEENDLQSSFAGLGDSRPFEAHAMKG